MATAKFNPLTGQYDYSDDPANQAAQNQAQPATPQPSLASAAPISRADYDLPGAADLTQSLQNRQAAVLARTPDSDVRQQQMALAGQLQRYATGQDSASALQLQQARDQNVAANLAMAAGARPGQQQMAALTAAQQMGAANTALAGQQALAGVNERQAAANALGNVLAGTRGQDIQYGGQSDSAYQNALAQQLALAQLQQGGSMGYSRDMLTDLQQRRQLAQALAMSGMSTSDRILRALSDVGGFAATRVGQPGQPDAAPAPSESDINAATWDNIT